MSAHWVVQENMYGSSSAEALFGALDRLGIKYTRVKLVPFTRDIDPDPYLTGPVIAMGATSMMHVARERGWRPGVFDYNMSFEAWQLGWGDALLNNDAKIARFDSVQQWWPEFFIRPCEDTKAFDGQVMDWTEFEDWRRRVLVLNEDGYGYTCQGGKRAEQLQEGTLVVCAPPKEIFREYRCFIVESKVITGSLYKVYGRVRPQRLDEPEVINFANEKARQWSPDAAYAMDVAVTPDGLKIIEVNQINSAGFYAADVQKLVAALDDLT